MMLTIPDMLNSLVAPGKVISGTSPANTAQTLRVPGQAGRQLFLTGYLVWIDEAAAFLDITVDIKDGNTVIWRDIIPSAAVRGTRIGVIWGNPGKIAITTGNDLSMAISAGGASVVTVGNLSYSN